MDKIIKINILLVIRNLFKIYKILITIIVYKNQILPHGKCYSIQMRNCIEKVYKFIYQDNLKEFILIKIMLIITNNFFNSKDSITQLSKNI